MIEEFRILDIYEQNINFLFGAGASYGFLPTLSLSITDPTGKSHTFETLAKELEEIGNKELTCLLFMSYYKSCILPGLPKSSKHSLTSQQENVLHNYKNFLKTLITVLDKQDKTAKKANIYTTNYDNCFELASEALIAKENFNFVVNDGGSGFKNITFHTKNYSRRVIHRGIFDKHDQYLPQVNLLHPHGSIHWERNSEKDKICLNYHKSNYLISFNPRESMLIKEFERIINDSNKTTDDLYAHYASKNFGPLNKTNFWESFKKIPIVNPTKWKFHETVFEEAYYQILRHLSYELERPNTILLTFGFSFADEHILNLVQRSLSNPSLTIYITCFNCHEKTILEHKFRGFNNVKFISDKENLDFLRFNDSVFTLKMDK